MLSAVRSWAGNNYDLSKGTQLKGVLTRAFFEQSSISLYHSNGVVRVKLRCRLSDSSFSQAVTYEQL